MVPLRLTFLELGLTSSLENNFTFNNTSCTAAEDGNYHKISNVLGYFRYTVKSLDGTLHSFTHHTLPVE